MFKKSHLFFQKSKKKNPRRYEIPESVHFVIKAVNTSLVKQCIFFSCLDPSTKLVYIITELRYNSVRLVGAAKEHAFLVYLETQYNTNLFRNMGYLRNCPPKTRDGVVWVSLEVAPSLRQCSLVDYL